MGQFLDFMIFFKKKYETRRGLCHRKSHFFSNNNLEIIGENKSNMCFEVEELEVFIVTY